MGLTAKDSPETLMIFLDSGEPAGPFGAESVGKGAIDGGCHQRSRAGRRRRGTRCRRGEGFELRVSQGSCGIRAGPVTAAIRPEKIEILKSGKAGKLVSGNIIEGNLMVVVFLGLIVRLVVRTAGLDVIVDFLEKSYEEPGVERGDSLRLYLPPDAFRVYER